MSKVLKCDRCGRCYTNRNGLRLDNKTDVINDLQISYVDLCPDCVKRLQDIPKKNAARQTSLLI